MEIDWRKNYVFYPVPFHSEVAEVEKVVKNIVLYRVEAPLKLRLSRSQLTDF